jgi:hypothetical protein
MARFVLSSKDSSEEIPRGKFNVDRLAAVVPPPRIHRPPLLPCVRERPFIGNFRGDPERQELAESAS